MNGLASSQQALGLGYPCYCRSRAQLCVTHNSSGRQQRVHLREFGSAACSRLTTLWASARDIHQVHVAVQQRAHSLGDVPHSGHSPTHLAAAPAATDDSLKIIMLLSLSLTLMLLPWMSRHPEFLIAPALLAVTPVVGNGVRPVLKEVIKSLLTTLRLSFGLFTHHDEQQLPAHHAHDSHHHHHVNSHQHQHNGRQQHMQQQHQQSHHQQPAPQGPYSHLPQQPTPVGPNSPWPNPAQMPARWPPASARSAAARTRSSDVDGDWTPSSSPDPHHMDRHSQQHLQEVLAANQQVERELGQSPSATPLSSRSPSGSPGSSLSSVDGSHHGDHAASGGHRHQHHHHGRDPRMLSKEAKQQLYHVHHQQQQQQQ